MRMNVAIACWVMSLEHMWSITLLPNTPHYILTEYCSLKWKCVTWCRFSCIQECKFLVANTTLGKVVFIKGDINSNHHSAEFSIPVSMLYQSSQKFCVYWYWGLVAMLPEHHLHHTVVVHTLHLLTERNNRILHMASNVLWCVYGASILQQQSYHFHCRNHIQKPWQNILHL